MAEYIEREALMNEIHRIGGHNLCGWDTIGVKALVDRQPTADVVEVVRCSECQHWGGVTFGFICRKFSGESTKICMHADDYCSYGERQTE